MEELNLIIVEDEKNALALLESLISELPGFRVLTGCDNVDSAYAMIAEHKPDAILLDIQMPQKDGFVLLEMLRSLERIPEIIFVTAYEQYAIRAIRAAAFDYLLKPVKKDELYASLCRLREKIRQSKQKARVDQLLDSLGHRQRIRFNDRYGYYLVDPAEIMFIKADGNYSELTLANDSVKTVTLNLGKIIQMLQDDSFIRISRSCIINRNYLVRVDKRNMICELKNELIYRCSVSKGYMKGLEEGTGQG